MVKKTKIIDTNIILRFIVEEDRNLTAQAENLFKRSSEKELEIPDLVFAEIAWVLLSYYEMPKPQVIEKLESILAFGKFKTNSQLLEKTIVKFRQNNISFIDAYLLAKSSSERKKLISFDKKLGKLSTS